MNDGNGAQDAFDPYHVWLGIPKDQRPPHCYSLLGIPLYESNLDVIESAADRQMAHVRSFAAGKHGPLSQEILNQLAGAKLCLLNTKKKEAYDQQLQQDSVEPVQSDSSSVAEEEAGFPHIQTYSPPSTGVGRPKTSWPILIGIGGTGILFLALFLLLSGLGPQKKEPEKKLANKTHRNPPAKPKVTPPKSSPDSGAEHRTKNPAPISTAQPGKNLLVNGSFEINSLKANSYGSVPRNQNEGWASTREPQHDQAFLAKGFGGGYSDERLKAKHGKSWLGFQVITQKAKNFVSVTQTVRFRQNARYQLSGYYAARPSYDANGTVFVEIGKRRVHQIRINVDTRSTPQWTGFSTTFVADQEGTTLFTIGFMRNPSGGDHTVFVDDLQLTELIEPNK